jgi:hypothetical protein
MAESYQHTAPVSIVCMKWGTRYGSHYVNRLYAMVARNLEIPFTFYCMTDDAGGVRAEVSVHPLPPFVPAKTMYGPWQKLLMFQRDLLGIRGKVMFLDLDVIIVGSLVRFFQFSEKFAVRHEFDRIKEQENFGNTSLYVFEAGAYPFLLEDFLADPAPIYQHYFTAEQEYVTRTLHERGELEFFPGDWIVSFKEHCLPPFPQRWWQSPQLPAGASVLAFHGRPLPEDAVAGRWPLEGKSPLKALYKHTRACPWLLDYWRE